MPGSDYTIFLSFPTVSMSDYSDMAQEILAVSWTVQWPHYRYHAAATFSDM